MAKVWQIEYEYPGMYGSNGQDALYRILEMFGVENSAEDIYTDDFEVERSELQKLRGHIAAQDEEFRMQEKEFNAELEKIGMDREEFIGVLDSLINDSDRSDAYVHVSWF